MKSQLKMAFKLMNFRKNMTLSFFAYNPISRQILNLVVMEFDMEDNDIQTPGLRQGRLCLNFK